MENVVIIGSGPAGLTAAIYAARAFLNPLVISGPTPGGQLIYTTIVENFPGFEKGILGYELVLNMKKQAEQFGAKFIEESVKSVDFSKKPFQIATENQQLLAKSVIIATGARWRMLGLANEQKYLGKGIHTCATCDGAFYKDKEIIVVGGGDSAMEESIFLSKFAKKINVVYMLDRLTASEIMQNKAKISQKIEFIPNTEIKEYLGNNQIESVRLVNNKTNETRIMKIDGIFLAIGQIPNTELFKDQLELDKKGYIIVKDMVFSNITGVFVAGDVADWRFRQAITAASFGCMAALEVEKYLSDN